MASVKVPGNLPQLVKSTFGKARANGDLLYFPTQVTVLAPTSIPVRLDTQRDLPGHGSLAVLKPERL